MKNNKKIFLTLTLIVLLLGVTAVTATDNDTSSSTDVVSDTAEITTETPVVTEQVQTTSTDEKSVETDTKKIEKDDKNIKTSTKDVDVNNFDELKTAINDAVNDADNDEYIINLNEGTYDSSSTTTFNSGINNPIITINGNGQTLSGSRIRFNNRCNITINNVILQKWIQNRENMVLTLANSTLDEEIDNDGTLIIADDVTFGDNFSLYNYGTIISNNTKLIDYGIYPGNNILNNTTINTPLTNIGNMTIANSTINTTITNYGNLTIAEDVILGQNFKISGNGQIIASNIYDILPYLSEINGNYTLENLTFEKGFTFRGDITLKNCSFIQDPMYSREFENYGILVLNNSTVNITSSVLRNNGILVINDNSQIVTPERIFSDDGCIVYGERPESFNPTNFNEDQTIENIIFTLPSTNYANLTLINCNITAQITNQGEITFINCSFSNNDMTVTANTARTDGFLLKNLGNATLNNCVVENNTFNSSTAWQYFDRYPICGAIGNNGTMNIINSRFYNNSIGYVEIMDAAHTGHSIGDAACIINYNELSVENSTFDSNHASQSAGAIYNNDTGILIINESEFINNTANSTGGALYLNGIYNITNTKFTNNQAIGDLSGYGNGLGLQYSGGAIHIASSTDGLIKNSTFTNNSCHYLTQGMVATNTGGGAIKIIRGNLVIDECTFQENTAEYGAAINNGYSNYWSGGGASDNLTITNSVFIENKGQKSARNPTIIDNQGFINITNNTFKENTDASYLIYNGNYNLKDNKIINNTLDKDTIYTPPTNTITTNNNNYTETTINDTMNLDIPTKIYTNEPLTITGTYAINNPECYDEDILDQNQFNVFINGELNQTVNTLEFTITPTDSNMILTVQPTISQTRQSAFIQASTLNITLEPITATIGETTTLTAKITLIEDDENIEVNDGRVYFKVNGKILRDADTGRILYADVTENTATLDYQVPKTWNEDTEIEAVFAGNDDLPQKASNTVNPTITTPETSQTEFSVADTTATAGSEVTITVTTKNLDNGKVVLKVNGKTVKTDDGKLYAKVSADTTTFTYTVPKTYKAGSYDIKAVYTSGATKLEAEGVLMVE